MNIGDERTRGLPVIDISAPSGIYDGTRAVTVQTYNEANAKNGTQREVSVYIENMADGETNDTLFVTRDTPVILKERLARYTGDGVILNIFEGATYSAIGTAIQSYNLSRINPIAATAVFYSGPTITSTGVQAFVTEYYIGNTSNQGKGNTGISSSRERILKPNTVYLFRITSLDTTQDVYMFDSWYEGVIDLPLAEE